MLNIDIGGEKNKNKQGQLSVKWKILDASKNADYTHFLGSDPLPFIDNSVQNIYCSHTLEHIEPSYISFILDEFYRVLQSKGKCRIVVPDVSHAIKLYMKKSGELKQSKYCSITKNVPPTKMGYLTSWFHSNTKSNLHIGHNIGFDEELLLAFIKKTSFKKVIMLEYNKCSEIFKNKDHSRYAGWSLYMEMTK